MRRCWLAPLTPLYRLALALRELRLRFRLEQVRRLRYPVVSVGNLSTGGSGKTPLTIALAQALMPYLLRIARDGLDDALRGCPELAGGVYTYRGACVQPQLAAAFKAPHRPLADILSEPR